MLLTDMNISFKSEASVVLCFASIHFPLHPVLPSSDNECSPLLR